jgi:lipopolysaccharide export system permease protein
MVLVVLLALAGLFEFIAELEDLENDYQAPQAILYAALRLPILAFELMPVSILIGSLLGLGGIAANSEIVVMRAAGMSIGKLAGLVAIPGAILMVVTGMLGEFIGPPLDFYARNMYLEARLGQDDDRMGNETWVKDGEVFLHLERVNSEFEFGTVYLYRFDEDNRLESIALADNSGLNEDDTWRLENFSETRFYEDRVQVTEEVLTTEQFEVNAELLGSGLAKPLSLSMRGLRSYIDYLERNDLDASQYETEFWYRISRTVTVGLMPVLALAFVFGSLRSGGAGGRLMIGVGIGLAYYLASEMLANSGQVFDLNPATVSWLPTIALLLVTIVALQRIR